MKNKFYFLLLTLCLLISSLQSFGADDYTKGKSIYNSKCISCHGENGLTLNTPILLGQERGYLTQSLHKFKSGDRDDYIMSFMNTMSSSLSDKQIKQVSLYVSAQDPCDIDMKIDRNRDGFIADFRAGRAKVLEKNCMHCHSSFHHSAPRLLGQKEKYIHTSLMAFRDKKRLGFKMNSIAANLTEEEIRVISVYLSGMSLMRECK